MAQTILVCGKTGTGPPHRKCKGELEHPREYRIWRNMRSRCNSKCMANYRNYQSKGITVCSRWDSFENFYKDMGPCPDGFSIDRIDNNGNYCPENCRWASNTTQNRNKDVLAYYTYNGKTQCLTAWAEELGIKRKTLYSRRNNHPNYTLEQLLALEDWRNKPLLWNGEYFTRKQLVEKYNLTQKALDTRLERGWSLERALLTPIKRKNKNGKNDIDSR